MWRPWGNKSTVRIHSASSSPSSTFSCSSFKDIQTLCIDESQQQQQQHQHQHQHQHQQQHHSPSPTRKPSVYHRVRLANSLLRTWSTHLQPQHQPPKLPRTLSHPAPAPEPEPEPEPTLDDPKPDPLPSITFPGAEKRVVVYYTSLHVVRPTFDACKSVLSILCGFRVQIDERDVSMDSGLLVELDRIMGRAGSTLPRVFIAGRYVGGAEEVKQMHEVGELKKILETLPEVDPHDCHVCAGHRFILCDECNGSRKVFTEKKAGFKTCTVCNENGLVRCPSCLAVPPLLLS
ncbi:hypothetical protein VNO77_31956 [Canavalia gladiata]|uniref:Glutaredoxin domain-containing protein n=1 Tax=Canavalia gladiata TaxID=3824 RepID=A0AAN9KPL0_CANGL